MHFGWIGFDHWWSFKPRSPRGDHICQKWKKHSYLDHATSFDPQLEPIGHDNNEAVQKRLQLGIFALDAEISKYQDIKNLAG